MLSHLQGKPVWQEAENWQGDRLTIKPEMLPYLKEIKLKTIKI